MSRSFWQKWYFRLSAIEDALARSSVTGGSKIFGGSRNVPVEDDHIPFLRRGERAIQFFKRIFAPSGKDCAYGKIGAFLELAPC
jgi:hypothetical protein